MSAIAGLLCIDRHVTDADPAERMAAALSWRRGGEEGSYRSPDGRAALAGTAPPLTNETHDIWLVLDGEILNARALRHTLELLGHRFRTGLDAEVALHAYEQWELDFPAHMHGAFALALWDDRRDRLVLARDRLGRKPLFFASRRGRLGFASGIEPLIRELGLPRALDPAALGYFLTLGVIPAPATPVAGVSLVPAGEMLVGGRGGFARRQWRAMVPVTEPRQRRLPSDRHAGNLRTLLECAVADRLGGDMRIGLWLTPDPVSGALAAIATRLAGTAAPSVLVDGGDGAALAEMRALARTARVEPVEVRLGAAQVADALPTMVGRMAVPVAGPAALPAWFAAAALSGMRVRAMLADAGGSELLLGHAAYGPCGWRRLLPRARQPRQGVPAALRPWREDALLLVGERLPPPPAPPLAPLPDWLASDGAAVDGVDDVMLRIADGVAPGLDATAQAHGLEMRLPFLDETLADYAVGVPGWVRRPLWRRRILLRRVLGDLVPASSVARPAAPALPLAEWMAGPLGELVAARAAHWPLLDRGAVDRLLRQHQSEHNQAEALWALLVLAEWCVVHGLDQLAQPGQVAEMAHSRS